MLPHRMGGDLGGKAAIVTGGARGVLTAARVIFEPEEAE
jgi:hypothetical protein